MLSQGGSPLEGARKDAVRRFQARYVDALREFLERPGEVPLLEAYEMGRDALAGGLGVVDMAEIHHRALRSVLAKELRAIEQLGAAQIFFVESVSPFEMVHRGMEEANASLHRLNEVLEEEIRRIAQSLHDEAGQLLATAYLDLAETERDLPAAQGHVVRLREHLDQMRNSLRQLAHELRPTVLDDLGLVPALKSLAHGVAQRTGSAVTVEAELSDRPNRATETALYRIAQEALSNVARHAEARSVQIRVQSRPGAVHCVIRDDGRGFDTQAVAGRPAGARGLGLRGIRERLAPLNGELKIDSKPGEGTELSVTIPLQP